MADAVLGYFRPLPPEGSAEFERPGAPSFAFFLAKGGKATPLLHLPAFAVHFYCKCGSFSPSPLPDAASNPVRPTTTLLMRVRGPSPLERSQSSACGSSRRRPPHSRWLPRITLRRRTMVVFVGARHYWPPVPDHRPGPICQVCGRSVPRHDLHPLPLRRAPFQPVFACKSLLISSLGIQPVNRSVNKTGQFWPVLSRF